jgi:hypothetical protein
MMSPFSSISPLLGYIRASEVREAREKDPEAFSRVIHIGKSFYQKEKNTMMTNWPWRMPEELIIYLEDGVDDEDWYPELEEDDDDGE